MTITILTGDNVELLKKYPDNHFDSVVTDCPYGLGKEPDALKLLQDWIDHGYHEIKGKGFMGKSWDVFVPQPLFWKEVFRVLKPGGYVLAFFGTRTYDWGTMAIRLGGFEIRDSISYLYGSGFPKSLNVKKSANNKCCQCSELASREKSEHSLQSLPKNDISQTLCNSNSEGDILQPILQEQVEPGTNKGGEPKKGAKNGIEPSLEGWCNDIQEKGQLQKRKIHSLPGMGQTDGAEGRVYNGTPLDNGNNYKKTSNQDGSGSPHRPQSNKQSSSKSTALPKQQHSQESRTREICNVCLKPIIDSGLGTALKPAQELICVARKPVEKTVAENVLKYGTGGINIDGCRIEFDDQEPDGRVGTDKSSGNVVSNKFFLMDNKNDSAMYKDGRFPANVIFDPFMADVLDEQTGELTSGKPAGKRKAQNNIYGEYATGQPVTGFGDTGGASRFFYCAKASQEERNLGCDEFESIRHSDRVKDDGVGGDNPRNRSNDAKQNFHPTVKPIALMRYLQRLVTPKGGICLDPFAGSGTSGCAAAFEDIGEIVLMEMDETYIPIIEARTKYWSVEHNRMNYLDEIKKQKQEVVENQFKLEL